MAQKHKTNVQAVKAMMEYSQFGALAQMFIVQAISKYADAVSKAKPEEMDNQLISGAAWVGVAKEIKAKMDEHLGVKTQAEPVTEEERPEDGTCQRCGQYHQYGDVCP